MPEQIKKIISEQFLKAITAQPDVAWKYLTLLAATRTFGSGELANRTSDFKSKTASTNENDYILKAWALIRMWRFDGSIPPQMIELDFESDTRIETLEEELSPGQEQQEEGREPESIFTEITEIVSDDVQSDAYDELDDKGELDPSDSIVDDAERFTGTAQEEPFMEHDDESLTSEEDSTISSILSTNEAEEITHATPPKRDTQLMNPLPSVERRVLQRALARRIYTELELYSRQYFELVVRLKARGGDFPDESNLMRLVMGGIAKMDDQFALAEGETHAVGVEERISPYITTLLVLEESFDPKKITKVGGRMTGELIPLKGRRGRDKNEFLFFSPKEKKLQMMKQFVLTKSSKEYPCEFYSEPMDIVMNANDSQQEYYYQEMNIDILERLMELIEKGYEIKGVLAVNTTV